MGDEETTTENVQSTESTGDDYENLYNQVMGNSVETKEPTEGTEQSNEASTDPGVNSGQSNTEGQFFLKHPNFEEGQRSFPQEKVIDYAQKGYDYESKMQQFKTEKGSLEEQLKAFEAERSSFQEKREYWNKIDQYMEENPRFRQIVQEQWAKEQGENYSPPNPEVESLKSEITALRERLDGKDADSQLQQEEKVRTNLEKSISEYKEKFSDFDWKAKDEFGKDLQSKIEEFAVEKKFPSFVDAANAFLFDQHLKRAQLKAKEDAGKSVVKQNKMGLGPVTDKSQANGVSERRSVRGMSYNDLAREALEELGVN